MEFLVSDLLPGESAWVEIEHQSPHKPRAWARITERTSDVSASRTLPPCAAFGTCGGCAWQHLNAEGQRAQKCRLVQAALDARLSGAPRVQPPEPGPATHYRNKGKYVIAKRGEEILLGAYKPRSHQVVSTLECQVVEPAIAKVARAIARHANALGSRVYEEGAQGSEGLRYATIRCGASGDVSVLLICTSGMPQNDVLALAERIYSEPEVTGVSRCNNDQTTGVLLTDAITTVLGSSTIEEDASGVAIHLGPGAFWQLNRHQSAKAFADLAEGLALPAGTRVVELYCGVGAISFALAARGYSVLGVESNSEAIATARAAATEAGLQSQLEFLRADATNLPLDMLTSADAVVVDPPRKGLGKSGRELLIRANPKVIAYLSCGPASLAKDLAALKEAGYTVESVRLYDFMPGTSQVESLAILRQSA